VANLGIGIGCGIVVDGKILWGSAGKSGELGHTVVDLNGPPCTCGSRGCVEAFASGWALCRDAERIRRRHPDSLLNETTNNDGETIRFDAVILAANLGDRYCKKLLQKSGEYIGIAFSNAVSIFNPSKLILGGRLLRDNDITLKAIVETVKQKCIRESLEDVEITASDLGVASAAWGAGIACIINAENSYFAELQNK